MLRGLANAHPVENRSRLIAGALALSSATSCSADRGPADAAISQRLLATGGTLDLDEAGGRRAAMLATVVVGEGHLRDLEHLLKIEHPDLAAI